MSLKQGQEGQLPDYLQALGQQALYSAKFQEVAPSDLIMYLYVSVLKKIKLSA